LVLPIQSFSSGVLAEIVRRQPASKERDAFAWQIAVGPTLARSASVELKDGVLHVRARDPRWARELERAAGTILLRLRHMLGPDAIHAVNIEKNLL
jgi:predicted nucleic acid-binding Zn ribbon protein